MGILANCHYLEGYGLTEASPGISFNLPGSGTVRGSVGRLFKDIECKTIHPESRTDLPLEIKDCCVLEALIFFLVI